MGDGSVADSEESLIRTMWFRRYMCSLYDGILDSMFFELSRSGCKLGNPLFAATVDPFFSPHPDKLYVGLP